MKPQKSWKRGGGLKKAAPFFDAGDDFLLMNVDILTDMPLDALIKKHREQHRQQPQPALATLAVSDRASSRYFLFDRQKQLLGGWENVVTGEQKISRTMKHPLQKAFSGIHCISPAIFPFIGREGKFSIVDVYLELCGTHPIGFYDHSGCRFMDVGKPENVIAAEALFG